MQNDGTGLGGEYVRLICDAAETLWLTERTDFVDVVAHHLRTKVGDPRRSSVSDDGWAARARPHVRLQGRTEEAAEWFCRAARCSTRLRRTRCVRSSTTTRLDVRPPRRAGDPGRAQPLLDAALARFRALDMPG
jgi:hypothetical protein